MTHITINSNSSPIHEYVSPHIVEIHQLTPAELFGRVKVFVNGAWVGVAIDPIELYNILRDKKHQGIINVYTSIVFDYKMNEIRVCNDAGRLSRPVLRVKNNRLLLGRNAVKQVDRDELQWNDLITNCKLTESVIEYIDPEEQSWGLIAMKPRDLSAATATVTATATSPSPSTSNLDSDNPLPPTAIYKYTHCEIHPSTIFGVLASCIPFPEHNQSPRNTYQCLDINEHVLMSDGTRKRIEDVKINDEVVSFHPKTMEISNTRVTHHYVRNTDKKIYKLKTISGREIIATEDHKFMTSVGWKTVDEIKLNPSSYKIGIYVTQDYINTTSISVELILDETMFVDVLVSLKLSRSLINKYVNKLTNNGLLPLYNDNKKLSCIARIFGFTLSDGSINVYNKNGNYFTSSSFEFGTILDINDFENDVDYCGFDKCKPYEGTRQFNNVRHHTFSARHQGILPALLISLGISYGVKTEVMRKPIPMWIMNGNLLIKREFIAGFQGGDGCKIRWNKLHNKGYNFICAETSQQINPTLTESLIYFMKQCSQILTELGVIIVKNTQKQIQPNRIKIAYKISDCHSNLIKYFDVVGYRYANTKRMLSARIVEYLKYKNIIIKNNIEMVEKIRQFHDNNMSNTEISHKVCLSVHRISDIIKSYKNNRRISCPNLNNNNIVNWEEMVEIKQSALFIPMDSITEVENRLISDITVESDNHSFIAGANFLSSNCAQAKQAMGVYVTNYENRMDKTAYVLNYPARPLVDTRIMDMIHVNKIPSGCSVIVAIMTHTGYNQEDSLLFNKGSVDRGLFQATIYHTEKDEDKQKINGDEEIRCKPDPSKTKGMKFANYNKVNSKGLMPENTLVENRDVIISKITPIKDARNDHTKVIKYEDQSRIYRTDEETYIDKNYIDRNGDGYSFAKVRLRAVRKPVIGDKFSSRSGQKGTIGMIIPEADMPFTKSGVRPDLILNPHAIPSRMTIAQLKETVLGKTLIDLGLFGDGTSFDEFDVKSICAKLQNSGYESNGSEIMYNGLTGEQHECSIFTGPVFYQRLKHMVIDKQHSRSIGPMVNLTRQPAEGRSRDGGLRFGEMERVSQKQTTIKLTKLTNTYYLITNKTGLHDFPWSSKVYAG